MTLVPRWNAWIWPILSLLSTALWYRWYAFDQGQLGSWGCEMSWMTPSYILIDTPGSPVPRYKLYLYREQGWDDDHLSNGHPVIFIPGNAGSYQQARSIASSVSRQFHGHPGGREHDMQAVRKPDVFTLDLNEDFSAVYGQILEDQAVFLAYCIKQVAQLYPTSRNVTLVGHSMGGIVSRLAMTMDAGSLVDSIITLSTPHLLAPVSLDGRIADIYRRIDVTTRVPLVSICGGMADTQIASDACALSPSIVSSHGGFAIFTTAMTGVWTAVDHQAIVWCHQVRWRVARVLLEMTTTADKVQVAEDWFLPSQRGKQTSGLSNVATFPTESGQSTFILRRSWGYDTRAWPEISVQLCQAGKCAPQSFEIQAIPNLRSGQPFPLPGEGVQPSDIAFAVTVDGSAPGNLSLGMEDGMDLVSVGEHLKTSSDLTLSSSATRLTLSFPDISTSSLVVSRIHVSMSDCKDQSPVVKHTTESEGVNFESQYFPADEAYSFSHTGSRPFIEDPGSHAVVDIYQSLNCPVSAVVVRTEWWRTLARSVSRYRMTAIAWSLGWCGVIGTRQLLHFHQTGSTVHHSSSLSPKLIGAIIGGICGLSLFQAKITSSQDWLLGVSEARVLPLHAVFALWTLGNVHLLFKSIDLFVFLFGRESHTPHNRNVVWVSVGLLATGCIILPQQMIVTLAVMAYAAAVLDSAQDPIRKTVLVSMLIMLPFDLAALGAWARTLLADWTNPVRMGHNIVYVVIPLTLLGFAWTCKDLQKREWPLRITILAFAALTIFSFVLGSRYTHWLPLMVRAAWACLATALL